MNIRGIEVSRIWGASGVQGFFGEGYWFHWLLWFIGLFFGKPDSGELTFVAKTTTLEPRPGNMPLGKDGITPRKWFPSCVKVYPWKGVTLNSVGLSGPGAKALFANGRWQKRKKPFFISFMAVGLTKGERLSEFKQFLSLLRDALPGFSAPIGVQINVSCPNTGHDQHQLVDETDAMMDLVVEYGLSCAFMFKLAVDITPVVGVRIADHARCDGLIVSNAIKFGEMKDKINWKGLFGSDTVSPLAQFKGGGGLSGKPLLPLVEAWVRAIRMLGMTKHINAGGGILHPDDVRRLLKAGSNTVSVGTIAVLRPWWMRRCIRVAHSYNIETKEAA